MPSCGTNLRSSCADVNSHNKVVVCYVAGWAWYRPGNGQFLVEYIDPMLCTHIIYAYAGLDNVTHSIKSRHSDLDTEEDGGRGNKSKIF
jgi:chitinase